MFLNKLSILTGLSKSGGFGGAVFLIILGVVTSFSFAPLSFFPIIFLSLPLVVKGLDNATTKRNAFYIGWWFGLGLFSAGLYWVGFSFLAQSNVPQWGAPFAVIALAAVLAIFVALSFVVAFYFWRNGASRIIVFAISWAVFEWLRGNLFTGFPWHQVAHIWSDTPMVMQTVSLLGSYGLSFLTVLVAASLVLIVEKKRQNHHIVLGSSLVIAIAVVAFGNVRMGTAELKNYPDVRLRLVQANILQVEKWPREFWSRNVNKHIELSNGEAEAGLAPTHLIWPETAVPYDLANEAEIRSAIMSGLGDVSLITGVPRIDRLSESNQGNEIRLYNSILGIDKSASVAMTYDKFHLVPFGEYLPLAGVLEKLGFAKLTEGSTGFSTGPGVQTKTLAGLPPFSPLVCYEIIFPSSVRADQNAKWILNLTNDAWFGQSFGPHQHFAQAKFRAVEEGVAVVRVAGTGVSGVIDPWGRVVGKIGLFEQGVLDANLPMPIASQTAFAKHGNLIFFLLMLVYLIACFVLFKREDTV